MNETLILKILVAVLMVAFIIMTILAYLYKEETRAVQANIDALMSAPQKVNTERLKEACKRAYMAAVLDGIAATMRKTGHAFDSDFEEWWKTYKH